MALELQFYSTQRSCLPIFIFFNTFKSWSDFHQLWSGRPCCATVKNISSLGESREDETDIGNEVVTIRERTSNRKLWSIPLLLIYTLSSVLTYLPSNPDPHPLQSAHGIISSLHSTTASLILGLLHPCQGKQAPGTHWSFQDWNPNMLLTHVETWWLLISLALMSVEPWVPQTVEISMFF